jgi:hypothetical protein
LIPNSKPFTDKNPLSIDGILCPECPEFTECPEWVFKESISKIYGLRVVRKRIYNPALAIRIEAASGGE